MRRAIALLFIFACGCLPAWSQTAKRNWNYEENKYGTRILFLDFRALVLGKELPVRIQCHCQPAVKGVLGFELTLGRHSEVAPFHFDDFEGPDAPGGDMTI
jgi:hypothetical protein